MNRPKTPTARPAALLRQAERTALWGHWVELVQRLVSHRNTHGQVDWELYDLIESVEAELAKISTGPAWDSGEGWQDYVQSLEDET